MNKFDEQNVVNTFEDYDNSDRRTNEPSKYVLAQRAKEEEDREEYLKYPREIRDAFWEKRGKRIRKNYTDTSYSIFLEAQSQ